MVAPELWGDGFAEDSLKDFAFVQSWDLVSPDEYILLFPCLMRDDGRLPPILLARLEACVSARAWRIADRRPKIPPPRLRSVLGDPAVGRRVYCEWFADTKGLCSAIVSLCVLIRTGSDYMAAEHALLAFLDGILADIQGGRPPARDDNAEVLLAFGAGFHPAYLWPEAAISHSRCLTAGWLGHLDRGRPGLMPEAVAEYISEAIDGPSPADPLIARMAGSAGNLRKLTDAAKSRLAGGSPVTRLSVFGPNVRPTLTSPSGLPFPTDAGAWTASPSSRACARPT